MQVIADSNKQEVQKKVKYMLFRLTLISCTTRSRKWTIKWVRLWCRKTKRRVQWCSTRWKPTTRSTTRTWLNQTPTKLKSHKQVSQNRRSEMMAVHFYCAYIYIETELRIRIAVYNRSEATVRQPILVDLAIVWINITLLCYSLPIVLNDVRDDLFGPSGHNLELFDTQSVQNSHYLYSIELNPFDIAE